MSEYRIQGQTLTGIADAIRAQLNTQAQYTPESMAEAIGSIQGGSNTELDHILDGTATEIENSRVDTLRNYIFATSKIVRIVCPAVVSCGTYVFQNAVKLEYVFLPALNGISSGMFYGCEKVLIFRTSASYISSNAFSKSGIQHLILDYEAVATLQSGSAFLNTTIEAGNGYIYVPDDLAAKYKVATNWATYADQIKGLSELPAEVQEWLDQQGGATT